MLTLKASFTRALIGVALAGSLAACVVQPTRQVDVVQETPARPDPHMEAVHRMDQVNGRINALWHHVDQRVGQGFYPPPQGEAFHHRLDVCVRKRVTWLRSMAAVCRVKNSTR